MLKRITVDQAVEMSKTIHMRSDSYLEFASKVAEMTGDKLAHRIFEAEITRRILKEFHALDAIPTWDAVNPNT